MSNSKPRFVLPCFGNVFLFHQVSLNCLFHLQGRRNKKLFWFPAIAPLISVILSTLIVFLTKADKHGVKIVKHIKGGLNPSSVHELQFKGQNVGQAARIGLISAIVALTVRTQSLSHNLKALYQLEK